MSVFAFDRLYAPPVEKSQLEIRSMTSDLCVVPSVRLFDLRSELGVILDSTGDILVSIVATIGVFRFQQEFIDRQYHLLLLLIGLYLAEVLFAFWRYGRISSFLEEQTSMPPLPSFSTIL